MKRTAKFYIGLFTCLLGFFSSCEEKQNSIESPVDVQTESIAEEDTVSSRIGIKMESIGGVYQIPCYVNGVKMKFIFDTGASSVSISLAEGLFLAKNGYLGKEDFIGTNQMMVADGSLVDNMEINLHSIDVAGIMLTDVKATVVTSLDAPLLLGQTALKRLGKIEIEGDSLFITPKETLLTEKKEKTRHSEYKAPVFNQIEDHWYDKMLAFCGYEGKFMDYLENAKIAYDNNLPELATLYCDKALGLKETYQAYGVKGMVYDKMYRDMRDGSDKGSDYRIEAVNNLNDYLRLNPKKQDFAVSGDTVRYIYLSVRLAWLLIEAGDYTGALNLAQQTYMLNPMSVEAMNVISCAYTLQGNFPMAEKWANQMLDSKLDNLKAYFRLAYLYEAQNRHKEAVAYYEKCLEIDPNDSTTLNNLALIYYWELDNKDYGIYLWKKAARLGDRFAMRSLNDIGEEW